MTDKDPSETSLNVSEFMEDIEDLREQVSFHRQELYRKISHLINQIAKEHGVPHALIFKKMQEDKS